MGSNSSSSANVLDQGQGQGPRSSGVPQKSKHSSIDFLREILRFGGDLKSLRFFKAVLCISFLSFSFFVFDSHGGILPEYERSYVGVLISLWGSSASQMQSMLIGIEAVVHFIKLRVRLAAEGGKNKSSISIYCKEVLKYSSRWLAVLTFSSYLEEFLSFFCGDAKLKLNPGTSLLNFEAVFLHVQSIVLISALSALLANGTGKSSLSINPWIALLIVSIASEFSDRMNSLESPGAKQMNPDQLYQAHLMQLSNPLGSRSVALMLGALCGVMVMRDRCLSHDTEEGESSSSCIDKQEGRNQKNSTNKSSNSNGSSRKSGMLGFAPRTIVEYMGGRLFLVTSLYFIFSSLDISSNFLHLDLRSLGVYTTVFYWFVMEFCQKASWAYVVIACTVRVGSPHSSAALRSVAHHGIWQLLAQVIYPSIILVRYSVFEYLVNVRFGFLSVNQLFLLMVCFSIVSWSGNNGRNGDEINLKRKRSRDSVMSAEEDDDDDGKLDDLTHS